MGMATGHVWGRKQYILAAIAVTLAVSTVAIVTSVILSPTRIDFSMTGTSSTSSEVLGPMLLLNFTLDAANPSHRAGVEYSSVTARLQLYSAKHGTTASVQMEVHHAMPLLQPPASSRSFPVSAMFDYVAFGGGRRTLPVIVVVVAQVRFKVGLACSRQYDVEVSCQPVDFSTAAAAARIRCAA